MGFPEFVIVIASIMALNPLAMDMMLPALPNISSAFHIAVANRPQMVLSTFLVGFGVGQFVMGPLSDRFGRRPVLLGGMTVYCIASLLAIAAPSFETLLLARALQGLGTSATRVIATAIAGFINSRLVGRLGMRVISHGALLGFVAIAATMLVAAKMQMLPLPLFMALSALMMFAFGLMIANFTALAMEPQGHIAGTASSLYGSITTLLGIGIGMTMGQDYDGTLLPFSTGFFLCTLAALAVVLVTEKGRLFRPHNKPV